MVEMLTQSSTNSNRNVYKVSGIAEIVEGSNSRNLFSNRLARVYLLFCLSLSLYIEDVVYLPIYKVESIREVKLKDKCLEFQFPEE